MGVYLQGNIAGMAAGDHLPVNSLLWFMRQLPRELRLALSPSTRAARKSFYRSCPCGELYQVAPQIGDDVIRRALLR